MTQRAWLIYGVLFVALAAAANVYSPRSLLHAQRSIMPELAVQAKLYAEAVARCPARTLAQAEITAACHEALWFGVFRNTLAP